VTVVEALTLRTHGEQVLLAGDAGGLVAVLGGAPRGDGSSGRVSRGRMTLLGRDVASGAHRASMGFAPLDPAVPKRWSVEELLVWHGRLAGLDNPAAAARAALDVLDIAGLDKKKVHGLPLLQRRIVVLATAILATPAALLVEDPYAQLDEPTASELAVALVKATRGRAAIVSVPALTTQGSVGQLLRSASDVCLLRGGHLVAHAPPAQLFEGARLYEITVRSNADALRQTLADQGIDLVGGPVCFTARLPEGANAGMVLRAASQAKAAVLRCFPVL
jgi:ABC-type multidrug transport system ATPase subunit